MRIAILVEGATEKVILSPLRNFLSQRLSNRIPNLVIVPFNGRIPTGNILKRRIELLLNDGNRSADAVIALTDVYTEMKVFINAEDAKSKMRQWVGENHRFHPHAAQYEFEAWLLPYWDEIQKLTGTKRTLPTSNPETVNHEKPPSHLLQEIFRTGPSKKSYVKIRDAGRILKDKDLLIAANVCPELKKFLNTILTLCGGSPIP